MAGAAVAVVVLLLAPVSIAGFVVLALLITAYELVIYRVATARPATTASATGPPPERS